MDVCHLMRPSTGKSYGGPIDATARADEWLGRFCGNGRTDVDKTAACAAFALRVQPRRRIDARVLDLAPDLVLGEHGRGSLGAA